MSQYCGPINVTISEPASTCVSVQPFSMSASVKHAPTHYISGNDPINHNQLSGLQGGESGNFYHLNLSAFNKLNSGSASFTTEIPSGITAMQVSFPFPLSDIPVVISNITSPYNTLYLLNINGITASGFNVGFSSSINNTGYKLQTLAYIT